MSKRFLIFLFLALFLAGFSHLISGEKRIVGARISGQVLLLRVDLATYEMDCSVDGTTWTTQKLGWTNLLNAPTLATVATSGSYSDLSGTPTLATVATSGLYSDLSGTPSLASVATSGSYADLSNKPANVTTSADGFMSSSDKTKLNGLNVPVVASSETTVTSSYTADWDTATHHRIKTTASTACALTVQAIPSGKELLIRVDNSAAGSVTFNSVEIIPSSSTGITFLTFVNVIGTVEVKP